MHKIGVISDTHGMLRWEVEETLRGCEAILHGFLGLQTLSFST